MNEAQRKKVLKEAGPRCDHCNCTAQPMSLMYLWRDGEHVGYMLPTGDREFWVLRPSHKRQPINIGVRFHGDVIWAYPPDDEDQGEMDIVDVLDYAEDVVIALLEDDTPPACYQDRDMLQEIRDVLATMRGLRYKNELDEAGI